MLHAMVERILRGTALLHARYQEPDFHMSIYKQTWDTNLGF